MVALITTGHTHDGAGSVTGQHIFRDPDRDLFAVERIYRIRPGKTTADLFLGLPFAVAATFYVSDIFFYRLLLFCSGNSADQFMFGCNDHEVYPENGIGSGGVNGEW